MEGRAGASRPPSTFPGGESMRGDAGRAPSPPYAATTPPSRPSTGRDAVWVAVSHGDVIKAVLADALGMHLDLFQRIVVDPARACRSSATPSRGPFVLGVNTPEGDLAHLQPPARRRPRRSAASDAVVGGGAGPSGATGTAS